MYNIEGARWILKYVQPVAGKDILEFGNQHVWSPACQPVFGSIFKTMREWYETQGAHYTSIDMNGQDGALRLDLSVDVADRCKQNAFDVVTNVGTSEHCGNRDDQQWNVFKNAFKMAAVGGLILHQLVPEGMWQDHCDVWYKDSIGSALAAVSDCRLLEECRLDLPTLNPEQQYLCVALRKTNTWIFDYIPSAFSERLVR